ncbi:hypothetical protein F5Y07DRAFT_351972 [Xylaria sp. FL0933]|nr:hypothetical protein F5Y07DRAFT_351972 [Xylaria sp. FL0933]
MSLSRYTCVQCTRRLSRLAQSSKSWSNPIVPQAASQLSHGSKPLFATRHYSTPVVAHAVITRDSFTKIRFTPADIPPREFWEQHAREPLVADLSADQCRRAAQAYADAALKNNPGWRGRLIVVNKIEPPPSANGGGGGGGGGKGKLLSPYTLHYTALMMALDLTGAGQSAGHLALHILHTLSGLNYTPSTLTLVRFALSRNVQDRPQFEPAVEALERVLRRIGDGSSSSSSDAKSVSKGHQSDFAADACTLRALIYEKENTREGDINALRWFRRAYELGQPMSSAADQVQKREAEKEDASEGGVEAAPFDPRWQWKTSFALGVGRIRMRRGELEKARDMYAMAASELDNANGYLSLADVLEKMGQTDTEKYVESLEKAAISGNLEAARKLGEREWGRTVEGGLSKWEKRKSQVVAEEWMGVAGVTAPAEG